MTQEIFDEWRWWHLGAKGVGVLGEVGDGRARRRQGGARLGLVTPAVVCVALTLAGCTSSSPAPEPIPVVTTSPAPALSEDPKAADAQAAALAAYRGYLLAYAEASQAADPDNRTLATYVADPLLSLTRHNIRTLADKGAVQMGAQTATVISSRVDLAGTPPTVTIHACLDYSALRLVYQANHSPVPNSALKTTRVPAVATVARYANGQWLVNNTKKGSDTC
ncbi:hypothetical protein ACQPZJ_44510 [Actinoplanes sp. CA-054009]